MSRVLITGAADGIGRALAIRYRERGAHVVGVDVDRQRGAALAETYAVEMHTTDLADRQALDTLCATLGGAAPFDVVVMNAGISCAGRFRTSDPALQQAVLRVNLEAPLVLTQALLASGRIAQGGAIVFVSSLSHQVGYPGAAVYAATKDGLASYARSLSVALAGERIHILRVFPGPTRTAHAARYAPKGSSAEKRMPPDRVAAAIIRAVQRRRPTLVPGFGNRVVARIGGLAPRLMDMLMRKAILDPLDRDAPPAA